MCQQDTDLKVLDMSHNQLTPEGCRALSAALAKPQTARAAAALAAASTAAGKEGGAAPKRPAQTPARGFNGCLQELHLSWNALGVSCTKLSEESLRALSPILQQ